VYESQSHRYSHFHSIRNGILYIHNLSSLSDSVSYKNDCSARVPRKEFVITKRIKGSRTHFSLIIYHIAPVGRINSVSIFGNPRATSMSMSQANDIGSFIYASMAAFHQNE
jgi:hypothetical protein